MPDDIQPTHDVVVIGAGSTGENVADYAHQGGLSVALVEADLVGGDCSYWACMPSKALLRSPEAVSAARAVDGARQAATGELDVAAVLRRRDSFTSGWDDAGQAAWVDGIGVELIRGSGRLVGARQIEVNRPDGIRDRLAARVAVVVCTGSEPAMPAVPGLGEVRPWTTKDATSAKSAPVRLAILGGGVAGCEMASAWCALGAREVSIVEHEPGLLPGYEPEAGRRLADALSARGVSVRTGTRVERVSREGRERPVTMALGDGSTLVADELLVATGRRPRTESIGLEAVGLASGAWLEVDDGCRVTAVAGGWLYAAGDVNQRSLLTHMGKYQARICGDAIAAQPEESRLSQTRGARMRPPPTAGRCPGSCSPTPRSLPSDSPRPRPAGRASPSPAWNTSWVTSRALRSTQTGTRAGPSWSSTPSGTWCWAPRSWARPWPNSLTPLRWPSWARCPSPACGTRCPHTRRSPRYGCGCSRPGAGVPEARNLAPGTSALPASRHWCSPPLAATTAVDPSITGLGLTMCLPTPSWLGSRPSASPTSWWRWSMGSRATAGELGGRRLLEVEVQVAERTGRH